MLSQRRSSLCLLHIEVVAVSTRCSNGQWLGINLLKMLFCLVGIGCMNTVFLLKSNDELQ